MNKQGILFQGLCVHGNMENSVLREEPSYAPNRRNDQEEYMDITYFLLYAICNNILCRSKVRDIKKAREEYLFRQAQKSSYRGACFWEWLSAEECRCAELVLGMLEDIRNFEDDRAEKSWISLWYLIRRGFGEEYAVLGRKKQLFFQELCSLAEKYEDCPFMVTSFICMGFLLAEDLDVKILEDRKSFLFYTCLKEGNRIWGTPGMKTQEIIL